MIILKKRWLLVIFIGIALGTYLPPKGAEALSLTPVRFELTGNPSDTLTKEILLINESTLTETYYVSFANFEAQGETGSPSFVEPTEGLGTWMRTEVSSVTLGSHQQKLVPVSIKIPAGAEPGGYFAVIFWGTAPPSVGSGIGVGAKTGVLVLLSIPGEVREDAGLLGFGVKDKKFFHATLPVMLEYRFRNDGADKEKPAGKITIRNTLFLPTDKLDANPILGNVLPNSTRKFNVDWVKYTRGAEYVRPTGAWGKFWSDVGYQWRNFALGLYSAKLHIAYGSSGEEAKDTVFFFVFPWQLTLVLILLVILIFFGGRALLRRYNRYVIEKARTSGPSHGP